MNHPPCNQMTAIQLSTGCNQVMGPGCGLWAEARKGQIMAWKNVGFMACGALIAGIGAKILGTKEAKTVYTEVTAAAMRGIDDVVKRATIIKENCEDIAAEAKIKNEKRAADAREKEIADAKALIAEVEAESKAAKSKK